MSTEYLYHGSPVELSEIKERNRGSGIYLTPSRALAAMFGAARPVKDQVQDYGSNWEYDLYHDYDETGNDTPRGFSMRSNIKGMKPSKGDANVFIHRVRVNRAIKKLLEDRSRHKVRYRGPILPVDSVENVTIPYKSSYGPEVVKHWGPAVKLPTYEDALSIYNSLPDESKKAVAPNGKYVNAIDNLIYRVLKRNDEGNPVGFADVYNHGDNSGFVVMAVRPEYQRQGIGSDLMDMAIKRGRDLNLDSLIYKCLKDNDGSNRLIESFYADKEPKGDSFEYKVNLQNPIKSGSVADALKKELNKLRYGAPEKTQTIKEILNDGYTSCWGISRIAFNRLRRAGMEPKTVYIREEDGSIIPTHQFTAYKDGKKYRVFDHFGQDGIIGPEFNSLEEAVDDRIRKWRKNDGHKNPISVYLGTRIPKPGKGFEDYMKAIEKGNEFLKQYPSE